MVTPCSLRIRLHQIPRQTLVCLWGLLKRFVDTSQSSLHILLMRFRGFAFALPSHVTRVLNFWWWPFHCVLLGNLVIVNFGIWSTWALFTVLMRSQGFKLPLPPPCNHHVDLSPMACPLLTTGYVGHFELGYGLLYLCLDICGYLCVSAIGNGVWRLVQFFHFDLENLFLPCVIVMVVSLCFALQVLKYNTPFFLWKSNFTACYISKENHLCDMHNLIEFEGWWQQFKTRFWPQIYMVK